MSHVDDLYEANDREPGEPEREPAYTLDQLQGALTVYLRGQNPRENLDPVERSESDQAESFLLDTAVPLMLAELREARQRIAEWEALPTREEWTVTDDSSTPPRSTDLRFTADAAMSRAARYGKQAWRQVVVDQAVVRPWEPIDEKPPF